jgi:multimeric flavodoxin WrbA
LHEAACNLRKPAGHGNTDTLLNTVLNEAKRLGAETELIGWEIKASTADKGATDV